MNYYINGEKVLKYNFEDVLLEVISEHYEDDFDIVLDEEHPEIEIVGIKYNTSHILKTLDPTAYMCALGDYLNNVYQDFIEDLVRGKEIEIDEMFFEIK